jgi:hypothetical protein
MMLARRRPCRCRVPLAAPVAHMAPTTARTLCSASRICSRGSRLRRSEFSRRLGWTSQERITMQTTTTKTTAIRPKPRPLLAPGLSCPALVSCPAGVFVVELSGRQLARGVNVTAPEERADEAAAAAWLGCVHEAWQLCAQGIGIACHAGCACKLERGELD